MQQLTNEGNILHLTLRVSPTGDIHKVMWNLSLTLSLNVIKILSLKLLLKNEFYTVSTRLSSAILGLRPLMILSVSSGRNKLGISPVFKMLLMSSRKLSLTI